MANPTQDICFVCEKDVNCAAYIELNCADSSIDLEPESGAIPQADSQGCFPVGPTCMKKLQKIAKKLKTNHIPAIEYEHLIKRQ